MPRSPSVAAREAWNMMEALVMDGRRDTARRVEELGLVPSQARALRRLEPGRAIPMSVLAKALDCDGSNVTVIVNRLERAGLVERRPAPHDRRLRTLVLTEHGRGVRAEVERRMTEPPAPLAGLRAEDARRLRDALRRMLDPDGS